MDGRNLIFGLLSFKSDDRDGNEDSKKAMCLYKIRKTTDSACAAHFSFTLFLCGHCTATT